MKEQEAIPPKYPQPRSCDGNSVLLQQATNHGFIRDVSPRAIAIVAILLAAAWGVRETWSNNYRLADAEFYASALKSSSVDKPGMQNDPDEMIAKYYLSLSEDFRRATVYMSFAAAYLMVSVLLFLAAYVMAGRSKIAWRKSAKACFCLAIIFLALSSVAISYKYSIIRAGSFPPYEVLSWQLAEFFGGRAPVLPLLAPSHLTRSCTVQTVIVSHKDFRDYLSGLDSNKDLVNLARVVGWNASSC
jgi:hypothetical protein